MAKALPEAQEEKPPWRACDENARQKMHVWVNAKLDAMDAAENKKQAAAFPHLIPPEHMEKYRAWRQNDGLEKVAARQGCIEPLRRRHP
jgi:hypothetical protein